MRWARWWDGSGDVRVGYLDGSMVVPVHAPTGCPDLALVTLAMREKVPPPIGHPVAVDNVRLLAPLPRPPSVRDFYAFEGHVRSTRAHQGLDMEPDWYRLPVFYFSSPHVVIGPDDDVEPPDTEELDFELEVAAVVGREARNLGVEQASAAIAGYTIFNDWSARDIQRREVRVGLGPAKGKDFASSLGPVLVTPDELGDDPGRPEGEMCARVNGSEWSRARLSDLQHSFSDMVAYASRSSRVVLGDVIGSGTAGTGCILELAGTYGTDRYPWLRRGDVVELEVEGIGVLRNRVAPPPPTPAA